MLAIMNKFLFKWQQSCYIGTMTAAAADIYGLKTFHYISKQIGVSSLALDDL